MQPAKKIKGRWILTLLLGVSLSSPSNSTPLYSNIQASQEIGPRGGSIMAEDPETGVSVGLSFPEGALQEKTLITLVIYGSPQPKILGKTHINGIAVQPQGLFLQEKAQLSVYNPPGDVTESMLLFRIAGEQFIIPLGDQKKHHDENWIEGTFYITGRFSLGSPTNAEVSAQCKKLAAYNPARPLAYADEESDTPLRLTEELNDLYEFHSYGGPYAGPPDEYLPAPALAIADDEECMRWQKALTKVEAHMTWVEQYIYTNNPPAEQAERRAAEDDLQEAIDGYLKKVPPANRCGSYIKAAAKYTESATLLGMNIEGKSPIAKQFNQLVDECSFVFTVEEQIWANHPKETSKLDGHTFEEKSNLYSTIKCHIPWKDFLATGNQKIRGEGTGSLHFEHHWVGDEKNEHIVTDGTMKADRIEGFVTVSDDGHGQLSAQANIEIYWTKTVTTHMWGKPGLYDDPYDETGTDTQTYRESKSYTLKNGYEDKIGNSDGGFLTRVFILKSPGDGRNDPNDCF